MFHTSDIFITRLVILLKSKQVLYNGEIRVSESMVVLLWFHTDAVSVDHPTFYSRGFENRNVEHIKQLKSICVHVFLVASGRMLYLQCEQVNLKSTLSWCSFRNVQFVFCCLVYVRKSKR